MLLFLHSFFSTGKSRGGGGVSKKTRKTLGSAKSDSVPPPRPLAFDTAPSYDAHNLRTLLLSRMFVKRTEETSSFPSS